MLEDIQPTSEGQNEALRPLGELLLRTDLVYHGIGADIVALHGIATHGILSAKAQQGYAGAINSNTPDALTKTNEQLVSVARTPVPRYPDTAFMTYIDGGAVSFVIDPAGCSLVQPVDRGFYDEAFIAGAKKDDVVGVLVDERTKDLPIASLPILDQNVSPSVAGAKARYAFDFLSTQLAPQLAGYKGELETLLEGIAHITTERMQVTMGLLPDIDREAIKRVDAWLQSMVASALQTAYGRGDMSIIDLVRATFPQLPIYVNKHDAVALYTEEQFFDGLQLDDVIDYGNWDGTAEDPTSVAKMRQRYKRRLSARAGSSNEP